MAVTRPGLSFAVVGAAAQSGGDCQRDPAIPNGGGIRDKPELNCCLTAGAEIELAIVIKVAINDAVKVKLNRVPLMFSQRRGPDAHQ